MTHMFTTSIMAIFSWKYEMTLNIPFHALDIQSHNSVAVFVPTLCSKQYFEVMS